MQTVERVHISEVTPKTFAARYRAGEGRPVVLTGAFDELPKCTLTWLKQSLPSAKMPARFYGATHFDTPKSQWKEYAETLNVTPNEYATMLSERVAHRDNVYVAQVPIGGSDLANSIRPKFDWVAAQTGLKAAIDLNLWWGPGGHTEPLHFDSGDGTLVQLFGSKRAALFPPSQSHNLYPFPISRKGIVPWISQVYLQHPDHERFPRLADALSHQVDVQLDEGEVLFIPANWWHEVTALSDDYVCSINRFWKVSPLSRLFTNRITPPIYAISMAALAMTRRKRAKQHARD